MSGTKDKSTSRGSPATIQKNEMEALEAIYMASISMVFMTRVFCDGHHELTHACV